MGVHGGYVLPEMLGCFPFDKLLFIPAHGLYELKAFRNSRVCFFPESSVRV